MAMHCFFAYSQEYQSLAEKHIAQKTDVHQKQMVYTRFVGRESLQIRDVCPLFMRQLAGCAKRRKHELLCKRNDFVRFLPRNRLWPPQSKKPLSIRKLPKVKAPSCWSHPGSNYPPGNSRGLFRPR